ncbi:MAG: trypsin-like peptidase domain-containing protein [Desulfofustis sp.]
MGSPLPRSDRIKLVILVLVVLGMLWYLFGDQGWRRLDQTAEPRPVTARGNLAEDEQNTIDIFRESAPSVVFITSIALRRNFFSLNAVEIPQGNGSGFIWDRDGRIVTNYHVISDGALLVGVAPDKDLAVLQISAPVSKLKPLAVGEATNLLVGQKVFAIGNPFGLDHSMTSGIISALDREITALTGRVIRGVIQTDAAINPGNSGGPLLDSAGRLIGVNTAIYSPSGAYAGVGFAVPVEEVNRVVPELIRNGRVIKPGIGVSLVDERYAARYGVSEGVLVGDVEKGSPADQAGLQPAQLYRNGSISGDVITEISGTPITSVEDLRTVLEQHKVGDEVDMVFLRNGEEKRVRIRLVPVN